MKIISPLPRESWNSWNNLDNHINLNGLWNDLGLPCDARLSQFNKRDGLHFSLYVVSESPETGVYIRLRLVRYTFETLGCGCDGCEDDLKYNENEQYLDLLQKFMSALGLEYSEFPTPDQSVALARRLRKLDNRFKEVFNMYFEFDEIAENYHDLLIQLSETKSELRNERKKVEELEESIVCQKAKLIEARQLLQRVLINLHIADCMKLVENSSYLDRQVESTRDRYENYLATNSKSRSKLAKSSR